MNGHDGMQRWAERAYQTCHCEHPIPEAHGRSLVCVLCGHDLHPERARRLAGVSRHEPARL
jgi:hypothetical protein